MVQEEIALERSHFIIATIRSLECNVMKTRVTRVANYLFRHSPLYKTQLRDFDVECDMVDQLILFYSQFGSVSKIKMFKVNVLSLA